MKATSSATANLPEPTKLRGVLQRKCACGNTPDSSGECATCKQKRETREGMLQRKASSLAPVGEVPPIVHEVLRSPGQALEPETRGFMESRFGHDFSGVRVHTDDKAAESARALNAQAYTVRNDVVFSRGGYEPAQIKGQRLLAHELTHVLQQSLDTSQNSLRILEPDHPAEHEALRLEFADYPVPQISTNGAVLQRQIAGSDPAIGARYNTALAEHNWSLTVRYLAQMTEADRRAALTALSSDVRFQIRNAALAISPTTANSVIQTLESLEVSNHPAQTQTTVTPTQATDNIAVLSGADKLSRAWHYAGDGMAEEARRELAGLFTPQSIAIMIGFIALYVAAQLTPAGWLADGIALATLTISAILVGRLIFDVGRDLLTFFEAVNATSDAQLRASGQALARAVARGGIAIVIALLTRQLRGRGGARPLDGPPPTAMAELVAPGFGIIRIPVQAAQSVAIASPSVLQSTAAMAVMVPPSGGPHSSSTSPNQSTSTPSQSGSSRSSGSRRSSSSEIQEVFEETVQERESMISRNPDDVGSTRSAGPTSSIRAQPGRATGGEGLPTIADRWFPEGQNRVAPFPRHIADRMRGMSFGNWGEFVSTFWRMVAADPILSRGWSQANMTLMRGGRAPRAPSSEVTGGGVNSVYQINHMDSLNAGGELYNMSRLEIVGPRFHSQVDAQ